MADGLEIPEDAPRWALPLFVGLAGLRTDLAAHQAASKDRADAMTTRIGTLEQQYVERSKKDEADYKALNRNVMLALVAVAVFGVLGLPGLAWIAELMGWPVPRIGGLGAP